LRVPVRVGKIEITQRPNKARLANENALWMQPGGRSAASGPQFGGQQGIGEEHGHR
jgi:hypothetical protein